MNLFNPYMPSVIITLLFIATLLRAVKMQWFSGVPNNTANKKPLMLWLIILMVGPLIAAWPSPLPPRSDVAAMALWQAALLVVVFAVVARIRTAEPAAEPVVLPVTGALPSRANPGDAGLDLRMDPELEAITISPGERKLIATGTSMQLPDGIAGLVCPRSGLALKHGVTVLNAPGVVDAGYRGDIGVILVNHGSEPFIVNPGDRIAQLVLTPFVSPTLVGAETLSASARGGRGFGSTGVG